VKFGQFGAIGRAVTGVIFHAGLLQGRSGILPLIERGKRLPFDRLKIVREATSTFPALKITPSRD